MPREYTLKMYNFMVKKCDWCGLPFKIGDRIVKTSTRHYHKSCYEKLLH